MKKIYLAGGCFWGMEEYFKRIVGILKTSVGYANSNMEQPNYELVCTGKTDAAETIEIEYDENEINLMNILDYFWRVIDPTILNRQGGDIGTQYRTGIYWTLEEDLEYINKSFENEQLKYDARLVTEIKKLANYTLAEEYHQSYLRKNPNGYCHIKLD